MGLKIHRRVIATFETPQCFTNDQIAGFYAKKTSSLSFSNTWNTDLSVKLRGRSLGKGKYIFPQFFQGTAPEWPIFWMGVHDEGKR